MKRILMIGTGGTIASGKTAEGLMPELTSEQLLSFVPAVSAFAGRECLQLLSLDSTNLAPSHWLLIAKAIRERYDRYDGFVTATARTPWLYRCGPQLSHSGGAQAHHPDWRAEAISFDSTDSKVNLTDAFLCACSDTLHGVMIVFNGKVIQGHPAPAKRAQRATRPFPASIIRIWPSCRTAAFCSISKTPACPSRSSMTRSTSALALLKLIPGARAELAGWMLPAQRCADPGKLRRGRASRRMTE